MTVDSAQYRMTPPSIILRGAWLRAVSYCVELDSTLYHTAGNWTPRVWYCAESISKNRITWRNLYKNRKYFSPLLLSGQGRLELWKKQVANLVWLSPLKNDMEKSHHSTQLCGTLEKLEYLVENETKNEKIFIHWSVAPGWFEWWKKMIGRFVCD